MKAAWKNCAFTLLELLVVLAIVMILAALALPSILNMQDKAKQTACLSNLRQIGGAVSQYAADNNADLPPNRHKQTDEAPAGYYWQEMLKPYLIDYGSIADSTSKNSGVFWCPADKLRANKYATQSYGYNVYRGGNLAVNENVSKIVGETSPAHCLYLIDMTRPTLTTCSFTYKTWPFSGESDIPPSAAVRVDFRHGGNANGLMLDGSVQTFTLNQIKGKNPSDLRN